MKTKFAVLVGAAALLFSTQAWATCGDLLSLTNNNLGLTGITVDICVTTSGGNTVLTLQDVTGADSQGGFFAVHQIGWKPGGDFVSGSPGSWASGPGQCKGFDGFGDFSGCGITGGNDAGIGTQWTLAGTTLPTEVTVAVKFTNGCTGFFGNGPTTSAKEFAVPGCNGPVPEPATMTLLGTGLLGLAGVVRRRLGRSA